MEHNPRKLDKALADLIAAAGEVAFEYSDSDREGYRLARLALIEIVKQKALELEDFSKPSSCRQYLN